jgi:eukaryotic-like serine/threonine-protein kinase
VGTGDIVGEMAILTGENRNAHVTAQTDVVLLKLTREAFEAFCDEYPEIRQFLTQTVSNRFAKSTLTADRIIGKYLITEIIGKGGWSIVYKGMHTKLNMPVAIKMLKHNMAMDADFLEEFQNEARTIGNLNHENIVKVYDIENLYRTVFIVMEYLEGDSLEHIIKDSGPLPYSVALDILIQVCSGLSYAHQRGIIHRDVKPGNIFLQNSGRAKLVDFGLACARGTRGDRVVGTPKYLSPEQIKGWPVDERSDIYSLGITFFRILTGQEAFPVMDIATLLQMQLRYDLPDPCQYVPELPAELVNFLATATKKMPEERYQNIDQVLADLMPLARKLGVRASTLSRKHMNLMSLFLFYREEHREILKRLIQDFSEELAKTGVILREADFKDV